MSASRRWVNWRENRRPLIRRDPGAPGVVGDTLLVNPATPIGMVHQMIRGGGDAQRMERMPILLTPDAPPGAIVVVAMREEDARMHDELAAFLAEQIDGPSL